MRRVIVESPFAGDRERNMAYLKAALADCYARGEAPIASHAIGPLVLDDNDPEQRRQGIAAGLAWHAVADAVVVYCDLTPTFSPGMWAAIAHAEKKGVKIEYRRIGAKRCFESRFWAKVRKGPNCWEWTAAKMPRGYGVIGPGSRSGKQRYAHRAAFEMINGPIPDGLFVCHHCDNPKCVRPDHLFVGTAADNSADAKAKGRIRSPVKENPALAARGERAAMAKLTAAAVESIRRAYVNGASQGELAKQHGVEQSAIQKIVRGRRWAHVGGPIVSEKETRPRRASTTSKLTAEQCEQVCSMYAAGGVSMAEVSRRTGISTSHVCRIINGKVKTAPTKAQIAEARHAA